MQTDVKNRFVTITIGTLITLLLATVNVTYFVARENTNIKRDVLDNQRSIQSLIEYNRIQDMKIEWLEKNKHQGDLQFQQILFKLEEIEKKLK